jgi:cyclopropane-fatty-acyl-phospholipid synthase
MAGPRNGLQTELFVGAVRPAGAQAAVEAILDPLDIRIDGNRPWDIRVHNPDFYPRVLAGGSLALGESYMDGWWDCRALDQFFERILRAGLDRQRLKKGHLLWQAAKAKIVNAQRRSRAGVIGERHYDIGNRLFVAMLDKRLNYSCAFWDGAETLDQAQENKLDLICRKIDLKPGQRVLDIGCGWGGFAKWAAQKYDARVLGLTVSREQAAYARADCREHDVTIALQDYRALSGTFDRIVSIGMLEHVGSRNYRSFMKVARRCLAAEGLLLVQTIGGNRSVNGPDAWIGKYIFPNSQLPAARQIAAASEGLLVLEDWHSFGPHYDRTLMAWYDNFTRHWHRIKDRYDRRFYRMWTYYLLSCAGSFRARRNQLWQIVFSQKGLKGGYPHHRAA